MININCFIISGKARAGKTETAGAICDYYNGNTDKLAQIFSFGDYVKEVARSIGWNGDKDENGRTLLQQIGQAGRNYNINTWVDQCIEDMEWTCTNIAIIDDVRFKNEIVRIKENFDSVVTIRVNRPNFKSDLTEEQLNDESEIELDDYQFDYVISNDGDLKELKRKVLEIIEQ